MIRVIRVLSGYTRARAGFERAYEGESGHTRARAGIRGQETSYPIGYISVIRVTQMISLLGLVWFK
jgi:hypothetical protein